MKIVAVIVIVFVYFCIYCLCKASDSEEDDNV